MSRLGPSQERAVEALPHLGTMSIRTAEDLQLASVRFLGPGQFPGLGGAMVLTFLSLCGFNLSCCLPGPFAGGGESVKVVFIHSLDELTTEIFRTCFTTTTASYALFFLLFEFCHSNFFRSSLLLRPEKSSETHKQVFHTPVEVRYLPTVKELIHYSKIDCNSLFGALLYKSLKCVFT